MHCHNRKLFALHLHCCAYLVIIKPYSNDRHLFGVWDHVFKSWITRLHLVLLAVVIWPLICCHHLARVQLAVPTSTANLANGPKVIGAKYNNSSQERLSKSTKFDFDPVFCQPNTNCSVLPQMWDLFVSSLNISTYKCSTEGTSRVLKST